MNTARRSSLRTRSNARPGSWEPVRVINGPNAAYGYCVAKLGPLLAALGLKILVAKDAEMLARIRHRITPRELKRKNTGDAGSIVPARRKRRWRRFSLFRGDPDLARLLRSRQHLLQTAAKRKQIARKAAKARWRKPRLVEITRSTPQPTRTT